MAGLALSGLASGFDWKGIVDQLIEVSRAPQKRMQREKAELTTRTTALNEVRSSVTSLKSSVGTLATESALLKKAATIADPTSKWNATAGTSATAGDYNFQVKQTATAGIYRGRSNVGSAGSTTPFTAPISSLSMGATFVPGFFMVNGQKIEVSATASLSDVANAIRVQTAGSSNPLSAGFNSTTQQFTIYSPSGGTVSIGSAADTSNISQLLKLSIGPVPSSTTVTSTVNLLAPPADLTGRGASTSGPSNATIGNLFTALRNADPSFPATVSNANINLNGTSINLNSGTSLNRPSGLLSQPANALNSGMEQLIEHLTSQSVELNFVTDGSGLFAQIRTPGTLNMVDGGPTFPILQALGLTTTPLVITTAQGYVSTPIGQLNTSAPLASANFSTALTAGAAEGSFFVNGTQIRYNTATDSVQNLLDRITNSAAGVTATFDGTNDALVLTNKKTGSLGATVSTTNSFTVSGTHATDTLTAPGSSFNAGDQVQFSGLVGGAGLSNATPYYVVNPSGTGFQLSATIGGPAINFTTNVTAGSLRTVGSDTRGLVNSLFGLNQAATVAGAATGDDSNNTLTLAGSNLNNGQIVRISGLAGGTGLVNDRNYFVFNASGTSFQLSETEGGAAIDFSTPITAATVQLAGDPNQANLLPVLRGRDAIFNINNGGDFISNSNTLDQTVHGINGLTVDVSGDNIVSGSTPVTQKITVKGDPSAATAAVNDFVTKYNALQAVIEKHTKVTYADGKVTSGVLAGSREMADISRSLRQSLFRDANGSGTIRRLADLGVSTSGIENTISLSNAALLESQINTAGTDVLDFFTRSTSGLVPRLNALLGDSSTDVTAASGKIGIQLTSIQKQNTSLDKQIADLERRLESQRQLMESSFIAMERAQAKFQQQSSYLQRTFSGSSK